MTTTKKCSQFPKSLTLFQPDGSSLFISNTELTLIEKEDHVSGCCLQFEVDFADYQNIEKSDLFNLKKELKGKLDRDFSSDYPIMITANLKPEFLPRWQPYLTDVDQAVDYLIDLSQNHADDVLINTENWYGMEFEQSQGEDKIGYRTFWDYIKLFENADQLGNDEQILNSIFSFAQEQLGLDKSVLDQELAGGLENSLVQDIVNSFTTDLQDLFKSILIQDSPETQKSSPEKAIFAQVLAFFQEDNWSIQVDEEESGFHLMAKGDNGQWSCYAQALDERKQFVFYSILPVNVPQSQIPQVLDFINRINLELMVGNFQLDPQDGQVVCKTSIDVEDDRLSTALVRQIVYNNVLTMNQVLPGLMAMIYANKSPEQALSQVFPVSAIADLVG
jgi:hypothetical protein